MHCLRDRFLVLIAGKKDEAEALYRSTLETKVCELGIGHDDTLEAISKLADWMHEQGEVPNIGAACVCFC